MELGNLLKYRDEMIISSTIQEFQQESTRRAEKALCLARARVAASKLDILKSLGCSQENTSTSLGLNAQQHRQHELSFASHKPQMVQLSVAQQSQHDANHDDVGDFAITLEDDHGHAHHIQQTLATSVERELEERFGKIISDLSKFDGRQVTAQRDQFDAVPNLLAPIAQFAVKHREIYEQYRRQCRLRCSSRRA